MKNLLFLFMLVATLSAQSKIFETREYDIRKMASKMGVPSLIPKEWPTVEHLRDIKKQAEKIFIKKISNYLTSKGQKDDLEYIEVYHQKLLVSATSDVHKLIQDYLKNPFIDPENFFFYIKVELFPLTKKQLVSLKNTGILEEEKQFKKDIEEFVEKDFRGIFSVGKTSLEGRNRLHQWFNQKNIAAKATPAVTIPNGFMSKLVMKSKKTINYISSYQSAYVTGHKKPLRIPKLKKLNRSLDIWVIPQFKKQSAGKIYIRFSSTDYDEPIKTRKTAKGMIHKPRIYVSRTTYEVGPTKPPVSFYTLIGAMPKIYMQLVQLAPISASKNTPWLRGKVIGVITRSLQLFPANSSKSLLSQLLLETGEMSGIKVGLAVDIFDKNNNLVTNGHIAKTSEQTCIVEVEKEISLDKRTYTYVIYRTLK